jgi:PAS domain S-box-containing protein
MTGATYTGSGLSASSPDDAAHQLFELSCDMLGTASQEGYLTQVNPAWERTLGWSPSQLMGKPLMSFVHPHDLDATLASSAVLGHRGRQAVASFENRCQTSAGDYRWLEWSAIAEHGTVYLVAKDVSARKATEATRTEDLLDARRTDALHRTLTANLPGTAVFLLDPDLRILVAEGEALKRAPWSTEDLLIGRHVNGLYSALPPRVHDRAIENYRAALQGEHREFAFASGGLTFAVQATPVCSEIGAVESVLVVARDITDQQALTDGLRRSEERLRRAEGLVGGGSWELSLADEMLTWSEGLCRIHGAGPRGGREALPVYLGRVHREDRARFREELSRCVRDGRAAFDCRIIRPDGVRRTVSVEAELVDPGDGKKRFVLGATLDVTDEPAGFDAAPLGMLVAEPVELRLIRVNDSLCSILGRSREALLGLRVSDLTHPADRAEVAEKQQALISGALDTYETEKRYLCPDGSAVWAAVFVTAVHNPDGSVRAFSTHVLDITDRRHRAAEVQTARVESLRRLTVASEYRDNETYEHTERVGAISVKLGRATGMTEPQLDLLRQAAPLHDIGKVGISDLILLKPGRLTAEERRVMERHTLIGADILSGGESSVLKMAEAIALTHHEWWDGNGYPNQLAGETVPQVGRIVAVADVFDALTHERPYKAAWSVDRAVMHICTGSGSQFDPGVVSAFKTLDHTALTSPEPGGDRGTGLTPRPTEISAGST